MNVENAAQLAAACQRSGRSAPGIQRHSCTHVRWHDAKGTGPGRQGIATGDSSLQQHREAAPHAAGPTCSHWPRLKAPLPLSFSASAGLHATCVRACPFDPLLLALLCCCRRASTLCALSAARLASACRAASCKGRAAVLDVLQYSHDTMWLHSGPGPHTSPALGRLHKVAYSAS